MEMIILLVVVLIGVFVAYKFFMKDDAPSTTVTTTPSTDAGSVSPVAVNKTGTITDNVLDINQDGKVDMKDAVEAVKKTRTRVKKAADLDGDGKVTVKDAKLAASKAKAKSKEVAAKVRGRKPATK